MDKLSEEKFLQALEICKSLAALKRKPTDRTFEAIKLFCEIAEEPSDLLLLDRKYLTEVQDALSAVYVYATSADNWRVNCEIGFGVKDHCSFLSFFLNLYSQNFKYFTGNFASPEIICEFLKDWKGFDLAISLLGNRTFEMVS